MVASGRRSALVAFALLVALLVTLVVVLTPWHLPLAAPHHPISESTYFTPNQIHRSTAFHDDARWPAWLGLAAGLVGAVMIAFGGLGRRANQVVRQRVRRWWARVLVLVGLVLGFQFVITLPFAVWSSIVARHYGLATQSWLGWVQDRLVAWGLAVVLSAVCVLVAVGLARWSPRRWWVPASSLAAVTVLGVSFVYPVVVEPAFNSFTPMPVTPLRTELLQMASRDGLDLSDVLVADASRRTSAFNAYVSGFGATKRLVVYDNVLRESPDSQVEVIVAHELGHASQHDVLHGTVMAAVAAAALTVGLFLLLQSGWWLRRVGARSAGDPSVVPLVLSLAVLASFMAAPLANVVSRHLEARADLHSLQLTRDPNAFILVQQRLATNNLNHLTPNPALSWWFDSHPKVLDRIGMGVAWQETHRASP